MIISIRIENPRKEVEFKLTKDYMANSQNGNPKIPFSEREPVSWTKLKFHLASDITRTECNQPYY